jgi:gluconokinase
MKIVISVDIGSSSVRCLAYNVDAEQVNNVCVKHVICSSSIQYRSVQPNTGKIAVTSKHLDDCTNTDETISILDMVDSCVGKVLKQLNQTESFCGSAPSTNNSDKIIAIGISTFVMNLVAIDQDGYLLGDEYTMSYACNTGDVAREVLEIKK